MENVRETIRNIQTQETRRYFEPFGRIDRVFVNGIQIKPWHIDAVLVNIVRDRARLKAFTLSRIDGICALRVAMRPLDHTRRRA